MVEIKQRKVKLAKKSNRKNANLSRYRILIDIDYSNGYINSFLNKKRRKKRFTLIFFSFSHGRIVKMRVTLILYYKVYIILT